MTPKTKAIIQRILAEGGIDNLSDVDRAFLQKECGFTTKVDSPPSQGPQPLLKLVQKNLIAFAPASMDILSFDEELAEILAPAMLDDRPHLNHMEILFREFEPAKLLKVIERELQRDHGLYGASYAAALTGLLGDKSMEPVLERELLNSKDSSRLRMNFQRRACTALTMLGNRNISTKIKQWIENEDADDDLLPCVALFASCNPDLFSDEEIHRIITRAEENHQASLPIDLIDRAARTGFAFPPVEDSSDYTKSKARMAAYHLKTAGEPMPLPSFSLTVKEALWAWECFDKGVTIDTTASEAEYGKCASGILFLHHIQKQTPLHKLISEIKSNSQDESKQLAIAAAYVAESEEDWNLLFREFPVQQQDPLSLNAMLHFLKDCLNSEDTRRSAFFIRRFFDLSGSLDFPLSLTLLFRKRGKHMPEALLPLDSALNANSFSNWIKGIPQGGYCQIEPYEDFATSLAALFIPDEVNNIGTMVSLLKCEKAALSALPESVLVNLQRDPAKAVGLLFLNKGFALAPATGLDGLIDISLLNTNEIPQSPENLDPMAAIVMLISESGTGYAECRLALAHYAKAHEEVFKTLLIRTDLSDRDEFLTCLSLAPPIAELSDPFLKDLLRIGPGKAHSLSEIESPERLLHCPSALVRALFAKWLARLPATEDCDSTLHMLNLLARDPNKQVANPALSRIFKADPSQTWIWHSFSKLSLQDSDYIADLSEFEFDLLALGPPQPSLLSFMQLASKHWLNGRDKLHTRISSIAEALNDGVFYILANELEDVSAQFGGKLDISKQIELRGDDGPSKFLIERVLDMAIPAKVLEALDRKVLIKSPTAPDEQLDRPVPKDLFWHIAAHLEVTYADDETHSLLCKVVEKPTGQIISALLQQDKALVFSAEWI